MLIDFGSISTAIKPLIDEFLDHFCLNETLPLESPTSENVARWIFHRLAESRLPIVAVTVEETCTSACTYRRVAAE